MREILHLLKKFLSRLWKSQESSPLSCKTGKKREICLSCISILQVIYASKVLYDINENATVFCDSNEEKFQKEF